MPTYRSPALRGSSIYPVTIQTPHGSITLAYRVIGGQPGPLFVAAVDHGLRSGQRASDFLADFGANFEELVAGLWAHALPPAERAWLEHLEVLPIQAVDHRSEQ